MEPSTSVILCAHNPRPDYLKRAIESLKGQTLPKNRWEFFLVDNASAEPLEASTDLSWHPQALHLHEGKLGLLYARLRGIYKSRAPILTFVDDDNILEPDYLHHVLEVANNYPMLGVWGGQVIPDFEIPPPDWTRPLLPLLALREFDRDRWSNLDIAETMPVGAGMCMRKVVAQKYSEILRTDPRRFNLGRKGDALLSYEDFDMSLTALDSGFGVGLFSRLKLIHLIPASRLNEPYFMKLVKGIVFSKAIMEALRGTPPEKLSWKRRVRYFITSFLMSPRERRFKKVTKQALAQAAKQIQEMNSNQHPLRAL
jgi:glycosyltransferase involved in cell wall biosynthesis